MALYEKTYVTDERRKVSRNKNDLGIHIYILDI
jgi:hypothetical protein